MPPAARLFDMHVCPMVTGLVPHVGGPILAPGDPTVLIGGLPAARLGDTCICAGPSDTIIKGSAGVLIGGKPAARMGDVTAHGGNIILGMPTVLIGETGSGSGGQGGGGGKGAAKIANVAEQAAKTATNKPAPGAKPPKPAKAVGPLKNAVNKAAKAAENAAKNPEEAAEDTKTFIGLLLKDFTGLPVKNEKYSLKLDSGQTLCGNTDDNGYAIHEFIDDDTGDAIFPKIKCDKKTKS